MALPAPRPSASPGALAGASLTPVPNGFEAVRHEAAERQARVWFNAAVRARRQGKYSDALALADTAYRAGPFTYLADEALLLRAQCADNLNDRTTAEWYARVAEEQPRSAYAPLTLLLAARVARRQGRPEEARLYLTRLRNRYPRSPQAAAQRMDLSSIGESSTTNVHGQRQ
jgi:TolA-binding protein